MSNTVPIPLALKSLIESNNQLLKIYQQGLSNNVIVANEEMMRLLGLSASDGWKLDINTFTYIKTENDSSIG